MFLPDVNVWLALAFDLHPNHAAAGTWYAQSSGTCFFCRWSQQGFLRLASNPAAMKDEAVSLHQAWQMYDGIVSDPRIAYAEEPEEVETRWREYTQRRSFSPKVWSDAYLAGFARAASLELVTFDKGFKQYKGLRCTILA